MTTNPLLSINMKLCQPTVLHKLHQHPRKSLSQNFLIDHNIVRKIVAAAQVENGNHILEIGPGSGILTRALLTKGAFVTAIEQDQRFFQFLKQWSHPQLTLICQNFIQTELSTILTNQIKIVANIPYHITGILLQKLLPQGNHIASLTLILQKEVADRLVAQKNTHSYSSFTLFTAYYATPKLLFTVKPDCFYPKPKVTSAVVQLRLRKVDEQAPSPLKLIRQAFCQRRKMLRSSLKSCYGAAKIEAALKKMQLPTTTRPQELSLAEFQQLHALL